MPRENLCNTESRSTETTIFFIVCFNLRPLAFQPAETQLYYCLGDIYCGISFFEKRINVYNFNLYLYNSNEVFIF